MNVSAVRREPSAPNDAPPVALVELPAVEAERSVALVEPPVPMVEPRTAGEERFFAEGERSVANEGRRVSLPDDESRDEPSALPPRFTIEGLDLFYGRLHALKSVNLTIRTNRIMALIGPSGCGKSTFIKTLNRMNDLVEDCRITGRVLLDGQDIYRGMDANDLRKRVGMVFQKPNPFPMSVYDNIAFGPRAHGVRSRAMLDDIVERSLRDAALFEELKDRLKADALGLSGGQQQRLCIARALAVEPEVLLMDEPTSALDPISTAHIEDLATQLKERYTIVIVTHNMQQAARISDDTAFFLLGEIVECSDTATLFSIPTDRRTEDYITGRFG